jgi:hypothetical protein
VFGISIYFHPSLIFWSKARSLPLEWNPIRLNSGRLLALPENIRIGLKLMEMLDTLAYYDTAKN